MLDAYVAFHAHGRPRAPAVITPQRRATYAEFDADVNRYAAGFRALGVGPERGFVSPEASDAYRHAVMLMALARLGVGVSVAGDRRADLWISDRAGEASEAVLRLTPAWIAATEQAEPNPVATAPRDPEAVARIAVSGRAADPPRRVALSWRRIEANALSILSLHAAGRGGLWVARTGLESGLGNGLATAAWTVGATAAFGFVSSDLPALLERHPNGLLGISPQQLREVLRSLPPGYELKPRWRVVVAGAEMSAPLARALRARLTPDVVINYAVAECGRMTIGPGSAAEHTPGAVGWPAPGAALEVVDPDGVALMPGEAGEVRARTDWTTGGYLGDQAATREVFRDGWYYTGDVGHWQGDGSLVIEGRMDQRMNCNGVTLLPNLLENALLEHPQVRDAAAFAMPGAAGDDECWIVVVCEGEVPREALLARLGGAAPRLPPIRVAWAEAIPRIGVGDIDRAGLRAQVSAALETPKA